VKIKIADVVVGDRKRPLGDVGALAGSIKEIGLQNPIILTESNVLVSGRHRLAACESLGWTEIPARVVKLDALRVELAEIDENLIRNELTVLERSDHLARRDEICKALGAVSTHGGDRRSEEASKGNNFHLKSFAESAAEELGVTARSVRHELQIARAIPDEVKEAIRDTPIADSKTDLLALARLKEPARQREVAEKLTSGAAKNVPQAVRQLEDERRAATPAPERTECRILEGDVLDVLGALQERPHCVVTDPPYGIDVHRTRQGGQDYADGEEYALALLRSTCDLLKHRLDPSAHLYFFSGYTYLAAFKGILSEFFEVQDNPIVWVKDNHTMCDFSKWYPSKHEYILFAKMPGSERRLARCVPDVLTSPRSRETGHSAEKPPELLRTLIEQSTLPGELVIDPFAGSGSTGVAASELKRRFLGVEIDPKWAGVAKARLAHG
jgi:ParB family transcriptional regulator, chromosome partitioning protein